MLTVFKFKNSDKEEKKPRMKKIARQRYRKK